MKKLLSLGVSPEALAILRRSGYWVIEVKNGEALRDALATAPERIAVMATCAHDVSNREDGAETERRLFGGLLFLDFERYALRVDVDEIALTPSEFKLFELISRRPGVTYTRNHLLDVMGKDCVEDRVVDTYVKRLRRKLNMLHKGLGAAIESVWGVGYRFSSTLKVPDQSAALAAA